MTGLIAERPVQLRGSRLARAVLRALGWRLVFDGLPARQGVMIVYPHTSNWDFIFAMLAKWGMGLPVRFWGKHTLFAVPVFGAWLRWLGGMPVDKNASRGAARQMSERMREAREADEFFWLALSPEGTRAHREAWRSGFYRVAHEAGVPLALAFIDYPARQVGVTACMTLSGDRAADLQVIAQHLAHHRGYRPEQAAPIRLDD